MGDSGEQPRIHFEYNTPKKEVGPQTKNNGVLTNYSNVNAAIIRPFIVKKLKEEEERQKQNQRGG